MNFIVACVIAATVSLQTVKLGTAPGKTMVVTGTTVSAASEISEALREAVRTNWLCTVEKADEIESRTRGKADLSVYVSTWNLSAFTKIRNDGTYYVGDSSGNPSSENEEYVWERPYWSTPDPVRICRLVVCEPMEPSPYSYWLKVYTVYDQDFASVAGLEIYKTAFEPTTDTIAKKSEIGVAVTNHVTSGYLCTVAAAQAMTNATLAAAKAASLHFGSNYDDSWLGLVFDFGSGGSISMGGNYHPDYLWGHFLFGGTGDAKWYYVRDGGGHLTPDDNEIAVLGDIPTPATPAFANAFASKATEASVATVSNSVVYLTNDYIRATNISFSNEVLRVGIGLDAQKVAQINAILNEMGESPIGTATTVGGLLAALAAAVAWLKQKTASIETAVGTANSDLADALGGNS